MHKFIPMPQTFKIPDAKEAVEKEWETLETIPTWQLTKVRNKRIQNQKEEERVVSKSRPAAMNLSSFVATSSSTASSPIASESPGMPIASGKPDSRMSIDPSSLDAA